MTKARVSIGVDTASGEPAEGPRGPYITDEHEDETAAARRHREHRETKPASGRRERAGMPKRPSDS